MPCLIASISAWKLICTLRDEGNSHYFTQPVRNKLSVFSVWQKPQCDSQFIVFVLCWLADILPLCSKGEEYVFRQDWGETMAGKHHPVLCVCDLTSSTVSLPTGIPDTVSVGQALWVPDGIVGVAWPHTPRRLGIVYCTNRLSYIFHLSSDGTFSKLA